MEDCNKNPSVNSKENSLQNDSQDIIQPVNIENNQITELENLDKRNLPETPNEENVVRTSEKDDKLNNCTTTAELEKETNTMTNIIDCENLCDADKQNLDDDSRELHECIDLGVDPIGDDCTDSLTSETDLTTKDDNLECIIPDEAEKESSTDFVECTPITMQESQTYVITNATTEEINMCMMCKQIKVSKYCVCRNETVTYLCCENCLDALKESCPGNVVTSDLRVKTFNVQHREATPDGNLDFVRKCAECKNNIIESEDILAWETMDFCRKSCLAKYQKKIGSTCASCEKSVLSNLMGKYCVRFGCILRQFCSSICLESYKKLLKVCAYCQEDMSATKSDVVNKLIKGQMRDFCSVGCCEKYCFLNEKLPAKEGLCSVCHEMKKIEVEYDYDRKTNKFCGDPCFVAFKFVNCIATGQCNMCNKHFSKQLLKEHAMMYDNNTCYFCSKTCQNIYTIVHRRIIPCSWCKVKKYNFDMIQKKSVTGEQLTLCSLNCLSLLQVSVNAVNSKTVKCDNCNISTKSLYHLTMSDASIRNFCSYNCVMLFQGQFPKAPILLPEPLLVNKEKRTKTKGYTTKKKKVSSDGPGPGPMPIITSVVSLAPEASNENYAPASINTVPEQPSVKKILVVKNSELKPQRNMATMVKPLAKDQSCHKVPEYIDKECQTDEPTDKPNLIPLPIPIYLPTPIMSFKTPFALPVPFPLPIQIPMFIPITKNTSNNVMKELKKVQVRTPTDPFEAELLMMAELVASNNKKEEPQLENDEEVQPEETAEYSPDAVDTNNSFGEDMLQMALKMATDFEEPAVDLEGALTANTITASQGSETIKNEENVNETAAVPPVSEKSARGRRKNIRQQKTSTPSRRGRRSFNQSNTSEIAPTDPPASPEPVEKPDANMCLKYTFGVNAWKQWVTTKNAELEKCSRRAKLFKPEILQLTSDELNYSLCLFVKEVRKPNGAEYAPDTIYYLCLGIQQYLYENGRIDNIFCDSYYEKFTDCLDEVCKKFSVLYNESHYIVTRVEEEHLWESKQLGAHSPHVLLSTLMFFNTKHFNLTTVDEHMQLSFSHIMKHWKRTPSQPGAPKTSICRNVLLRFYPPQTALDGNTRKRKVYEQQENEDNPLRCPVKLYEFYLSKCPESVKTRNDVFYLLPERSCVPDSPVWYSTSALGRIALEKMLHRVKMVKEVNVAVLTS